MNDGGPAFPITESMGLQPNGIGGLDSVIKNHSGLSLRDYFAAKAMQGILSQASNDGWPSDSPESLAECAYQTADAMLEARKNGEEQVGA